MELPAFFLLLSLPPPTLSWMYLEVWELLVSPRDRGAWWPAIYGVAQSRTQLKRLSSKCINGDFELSRIEMRMKEPKVCKIFSRELENLEVMVYPLRLH